MRAAIRKGVLFAVLAAIVAYLAFDTEREGLSPWGEAQRATQAEDGKAAAAGSQTAGAGARAGRFTLPERTPLGSPSADLFGSHSWQPPAPKVSAGNRAPAAPAIPVMPYRFAGKLLQGGRLQVFLAKGDVVVAVQQGDTLDGAYQVQSIEEAQITLLYLPLKRKETIPVSSSLPLAGVQAGPAASASSGVSSGVQRKATAEAMVFGKAARVLWEGPERVKLGNQFSVALRVTSQEPVTASPMQFRFDPKLLETVAVKPGRFFEQSDRKFSFRVAPEGSIFIGASNADHAPAANSEFLVLTFRPIKPAPVAELSIASLSLQGPSGRAIAFDSPAAFRTAIAP
jgi:hypothetical protein